MSFFDDLFWKDNLADKKCSEDLKYLGRDPDPDELVIGKAIGENDEGQEIVVPKGISQSDRDRHFYVVGGTGSGKTKFLETLIYQDIKNGLGFGVIDPHGDLIESILSHIASCKNSDFLKERVVLIDPTDENQTVAFNPLDNPRNESSASIASEVVEVFKKIWESSWGARMEDLLKNSCIALVENKLTLGELPLLLTDTIARRKIVEKVTHPICRQYFERFESLKQSTRDEWIESTMNKVNAFLSDDRIRQMLVSPESSFDLRDVIDDGKILLVKLDKGRLKGNADLLGSLLLSKIQSAAFSRTDIPEHERKPYFLYIDEFQNFATKSFISILSEARKYRLALTLAHQNLAQLSEKLRASILGNCGLQAYFRVSREDAEILAKESLSPLYIKEEGWESYIQQVQELPPRVCVVKNKTEGGVIAVRTLDAPETKHAPHTMIGVRFMLPRKDIEDSYMNRINTLTSIEEPESYGERV